mgnify:CR=1 FL=1
MRRTDHRWSLAVDLDGLVLRVEADDGRNVLRARQVVDDGVQHRLHTLVLEGGAAEHRVGLTVDGELADAGADLVLGQFAGLEVLLEQLLVGLGDLVEQLGTILLSLVLQVGRDVGGVVVGTQIAGNVVPDVGFMRIRSTRRRSRSQRRSAAGRPAGSRPAWS